MASFPSTSCPIRFTAIDANGALFGYSDKPHRDTNTTWSVRETGYHAVFLGYVEPPVDFKLTLIKINA